MSKSRVLRGVGIGIVTILGVAVLILGVIVALFGTAQFIQTGAYP